MLDELKYEDFAGQLNTKFRVVEAEDPLEIELIEVSEPKTGGSQEYFSLCFQSEKDKFLPQKLYDLEHETLGRGSIFLVPIGADDNGVRYEAVFNRMKQD